MRLFHTTLTLSAAAGLGLLLAACTGTGSAPAPTAAPPASAPPKAAAASPAAKAGASPAAALPTGPAAVKVTQNPTLGAILTDSAGRTLYMFTKDADKSSTCYDQCERNWPPLLTQGQPQATSGADATKLSTTTRKDNSVQVVYGDFPLYYYTPDTAPGETKGQGVGSVWYVLGADAKPMK